MPIPNVWTSSRGHLHHERLRIEAVDCSRNHLPPVSAQEWTERAARLRETLSEKLRLRPVEADLDAEFHRELLQDGYKVVPVSFCSRPGIRVTGTLYIPDGAGPFPAVLNVHGHFSEGKIAPRVQARGHALAQRGFVVLTVDAPGSGERGDTERQWEYHGSMRAAGLFLAGETLLGWQVRDNRRALDVLQSLPFVDAERIGVTGASGGGNQTMWLSAMDDRVKVAVPVVSVGSFEAYVGRRNCLCETLPGGLALTEEWGVLGLIAPRPLLILNSMHDQPSFGVPELTSTARQTQEIYELFRAREKFDYRFLDVPHGYWPPMLEAMLGWMQYWLKGEGAATPAQLPDLTPIPGEQLLCFEAGTRREACGYASGKRALFAEIAPFVPASPEEKRRELAAITGWRNSRDVSKLAIKETLPNGMQKAVVNSPRGIPIPVILSPSRTGTGEIRLIVSPGGKQSPFVEAEWKAALDAGAAAAAIDCPAVGELAWELDDVAEGKLHDSARACLWLGYSLAAEWAEVIAGVARSLEQARPGAKVTVVAEKEAVFAALIAGALDPEFDAALVECDAPGSLRPVLEAADGSFVWIVPGFLEWGDLDLLRELAAAKRGIAPRA